MRAQRTFVDARRLLYMICSACKTVDDSFGSIQDLFALYSRERLQASPLHVCRCSLAMASSSAQEQCCTGHALNCAYITIAS